MRSSLNKLQHVALVPDVGSDSQNSLEQSYKSAFWVNWYQPVGRMLEHMQGFICYRADLWPRLPLVWFWGRSFFRLGSVCKDSFWLWILCIQTMFRMLFCEISIKTEPEPKIRFVFIKSDFMLTFCLKALFPAFIIFNNLFPVGVKHISSSAPAGVCRGAQEEEIP